jgi:hypothetical protein
LGCGKPPLVDYIKNDREIEVEFTRELVDEICSQTGVEPNAEAATQIYWAANVGHIGGILGTYWDCCPRWYSEFADPEVLILAADAVAAANDIDRGLTLDEYWSTIGIRGRRMLRAAIDTIKSEQIEARRRADEESRRKLAKGSGRGGRRR